MANDLESDLSNTNDQDEEHNMDFIQQMKDDPDKSSIKRQKPMLKCVVCGDSAFGYNFDAISCESCKAFFRRTATKPSGKLKCRGNGHCEVTVEKRKRCKKCRLEKCFAMGMRKEWILTDDEKRRKKSQIEENRRRKQKSGDDSESHRTNKQLKTTHTTSPPSKISDITSITPKDWSRINQVQFAYDQTIILNKVVGIPTYPATQRIRSTVELIRIPTYLASIRLITFLKQIPEFRLFDPDDRVILVKYNLLAVVFLHTVLIYDPTTDTYHERNTDDPIFQGKDWIEILGKAFYEDLTKFHTEFLNMIGKDEVFIKIFFLIILFTKGFCAYDILCEPTLKNSSLILQTQNYYLEMLYKYCLYRYGLPKTDIMFINMLRHLFAIQRLAVDLKDYIHNHIDPAEIPPLMQSVLQLTETTSAV